MASLDELYKTVTTAQPQPKAPSLDDLYRQANGQSAYTPAPAPVSAPAPNLDALYKQATGTSEEPIKYDNDKVYDAVVGAAKALAKPAELALEGLSYLDKPRGAIAGSVKALQDGTSVVEGASKGWKDNTSWGELFPEDFKKENPYYLATIGGLAADIALDPLWFVTPAKLASATKATSKAVGLTDAINPAVKAVKESEAGQAVKAWGEDVLIGKNRLEDDVAKYNAGRASDQLELADVRELTKKELAGSPDADKALIDYVEGSVKPASKLDLTPNMQTDILDLHKNNKLEAEIKAGNVSKENAYDAFRNSGEEIPSTLLDVRQSQARADGVKDAMLPGYQYRDEVLASIPSEPLRKAIQKIGDSFIDINTKQSEKLYNTGRLSDAQAVKFSDGSHLRRSFEKYDNPEKFLEDLRKNGTPQEYARAYKDLANSKAPGAQGFGKAHRVQMKDFGERQALSSETLEKLGMVGNAEYRMADTLNRASKTIREDEFLAKVAADWGVDLERAAALSRNLPERRRYLQIPESEGYGALAGKWVPKDVYQQVLNVTGTNTSPEGLQKTIQTLTSWWKVAKLANPSSVARNFYSGLPMANVFGQVPMTALPKYMYEMRNLFSKGKLGNPRIRELMQTGIMDNVFSKQELQNILAGKPNMAKQLAEKAMDAFGAPDQFWRGVVYFYHKDKGKSMEEAAKISDRAFFNYSQAPEWINTISKNGIVPFAKFPYFATRETARAVYERPAEISKFLKPQNQDSSEDRDKILPDYLKSKTLLPLGTGERTVNGKTQKVQNNLDLSYILPFSNDVSLGNPLTEILQVIRTGKNSIGMEIIKPNMTPEQETKALAKVVFNALGPSAPVPGTYAWDKLINGLTGGVDAKGRQYDALSATFDVGLGLRNVPINTEELFKQKMGSYERQKKDTVARMREVAQDKRYQSNPQQQKEILADYQKQLKQIAEKQKETSEAYKRQRKTQ